MNIWEEPDHVRIAAAKERVLEMLARCPGARDPENECDDRLLNQIVATVVVLSSPLAHVAVAGCELDPLERHAWNGR